MKYVSNSTKETAKIAKEFAKKIFNIKNSKGAVVVGLGGELGAGKTTFTKSFAKALGIKETVKSPTFNILKKYEIKNKKSKADIKPLSLLNVPKEDLKFLYHIDAYRINNAKEILEIGWKEIIKDSNNIILVEWAENIKKVFPKAHFWLKFAHVEEGSRGVDIKEVK